MRSISFASYISRRCNDRHFSYIIDILALHQASCSTAVSSYRRCNDGHFSVSDLESAGDVRGMPGYSPRMAPGDAMRAVSRSPGSGTDADSAIGADAESSTRSVRDILAARWLCAGHFLDIFLQSGAEARDRLLRREGGDLCVLRRERWRGI